MPETNMDNSQFPKQPWINHKTLYTVIAVLLVVLVVGAVAWYRQQKQITEDLKPITPVASTQSQDATAGWKTYTNAQYGLSFKYPEPVRESNQLSSPIVKGAYVEDKGNVITIIPSTGGQLIIFLNNSHRFDYSQWKNGVDYRLTEITVGGKKVMIYEKINPNLLGAIKDITVADPPAGWDSTNQIYYDLNDNSNTESIKLFDQILSTFKFTNSSLTTESYKQQVLNQFKDLTSWTTQDNVSDWRPVNFDSKLLGKYGTGKKIIISKSFNENGELPTDNAQGLLEDSVKTTLNNNGWKLITGPTDGSFYNYYLYEKDGKPLLYGIGTRDAVRGGMFAVIQFQY